MLRVEVVEKSTCAKAQHLQKAAHMVCREL